MSAEREPMTPSGYESLKLRLKELKEKEMPRISEEIGAARELGDLAENAEYHAAKEKQGMVAARMRAIEDKLARAEVIDPAKLSGPRVIFGAWVTLLDLDTDQEQSVQIVGEDEADSKAGRISYTSPMARALIGKEEGAEAIVQVPKGKKEYEILKVEYKPGQ